MEILAIVYLTCAGAGILVALTITGCELNEGWRKDKNKQEVLRESFRIFSMISAISFLWPIPIALVAPVVALATIVGPFYGSYLLGVKATDKARTWLRERVENREEAYKRHCLEVENEYKKIQKGLYLEERMEEATSLIEKVR